MRTGRRCCRCSSSASRDSCCDSFGWLPVPRRKDCRTRRDGVSCRASPRWAPRRRSATWRASAGGRSRSSSVRRCSLACSCWRACVHGAVVQPRRACNNCGNTSPDGPRNEKSASGVSAVDSVLTSMIVAPDRWARSASPAAGYTTDAVPIDRKTSQSAAAASASSSRVPGNRFAEPDDVGPQQLAATRAFRQAGERERRTSGDRSFGGAAVAQDVAVVFDDARAARTLVQSVDVLRDQRQSRHRAGQLDQRPVTRVRFDLAHEFTTPFVPFPDALADRGRTLRAWPGLRAGTLPRARSARRETWARRSRQKCPRPSARTRAALP